MHSYKQPVLGLVWSLGVRLGDTNNLATCAGAGLESGSETVDTNNLSFPHSEEQHNAREVTTPITM